MDTYRIVGARRYSFKSDDGRMIEGYTVYCLVQPSSSKNVIGYYADKFTLSESNFERFNVESLVASKATVELYYNKYGRVSNIVRVSDD